MRSSEIAGRWLGALLLVVAVSGCGDDAEDDSSCALRTTGLSGEAPSCTNRLECGDDEWQLECDGMTSQCTCIANGVDQKTIPYEDQFCPVDFSNADFDAHEVAAAEACGWP